MKVLFDTNVILYLLLDREPFSDAASYLLSKVERSEIIGYVCATTITTIHYLATKALGAEAASALHQFPAFSFCHSPGGNPYPGPDPRRESSRIASFILPSTSVRPR